MMMHGQIETCRAAHAVPAACASVSVDRMRRRNSDAILQVPASVPDAASAQVYRGAGA